MAPPPEDESGGAGVGRCCVGGARWVLLGLALGQFVSLLITSTGFASSELARRGAYRPYTHALTPPRTRLICFTAAAADDDECSLLLAAIVVPRQKFGFLTRRKISQRSCF